VIKLADKTGFRKLKRKLDKVSDEREKMNLDVCVVGYGLMGRTHSEMYDANPYVKSITIIDPYLTFLDSKDYKKKIKFTKNITNNESFDIMSICTPSSTHYKLFRKYAKQTKAILLEKPPALSVEEARKIQEIGSELDIIVGCAFVERFNSEIKKFKEKIKDIKGDVNYYFTRISPRPSKESWYSDETISGGLLLDLGIHDIDLVRWIIGKNFNDICVKKEYNQINCKLSFPSNLIVNITLGWHNNKKFINTIYCKGKDFNIRLNTANLERERYPNAYKREIDNFVDLLKGKKNEFPLIEEGIGALELINRIKQYI